MTEADKHWIDVQSLESLLRHWRFAPAGDRLLANDTGVYYSKVMFARKEKDPSGWVRASKNVGWG